LHGVAAELTVHFPWGSLLRGVLGADDSVLAGMAQLLAPGATATVLVSVLPRDGVPEIPAPRRLVAIYAEHGLSLVEARAATEAEVAASRSSWAKRLRAGRVRPVTLLSIVKAGPDGSNERRAESAAALAQ
jgi:16S rRNA (adenine(1408)-N(1))-methyltransferase